MRLRSSCRSDRWCGRDFVDLFPVALLRVVIDVPAPYSPAPLSEVEGLSAVVLRLLAAGGLEVILVSAVALLKLTPLSDADEPAFDQIVKQAVTAMMANGNRSHQSRGHLVPDGFIVSHSSFISSPARRMLLIEAQHPARSSAAGSSSPPTG
jgi:hypothetical protein